VKYIAYTIGAVSTLYLLVMGVVSTVLTTSSQETWEKMKASPFQCPPGTEVTYRGWSENGNLRYCEPDKNGPWEAWMSGYKWVDGGYLNGKKHGQWRWFNEEGEVIKVVHYNHGQEVEASQ